MIRRPPRSTQSRSSAASDVYKRQPAEPRGCGPLASGDPGPGRSRPHAGHGLLAGRPSHHGPSFAATADPVVLSHPLPRRPQDLGQDSNQAGPDRGGPSATPGEANGQTVYPVNGQQKSELLIRLLEKNQLDRVLVFTRTKHRADKVCRHLERSQIRGAAIHSNRSQTQRKRALDGFKKGTYRVLVATDIVSRGIDVDAISHVINYDLPVNAQDYVHRIGRT